MRLALVMLAACGGDKEPPKQEPPPRPTPIDAAVRPDAPPDAPPPAIDPAIAARLPDPPLVVATIDVDALVVANVGRTGVEQVLRLDGQAHAGFGWVDEHTLVAFEHDRSGAVTYYRIEDGHLTDHAPIDSLMLRGNEVTDVRLEIARPDKGTPQAWISACAEQDGAGHCKKPVHVRVAPKPVEVGTPPAIDPMRAVNTDIRTYPIPELKPPIPAPADVSVKLVTIAGLGMLGIECRAPAGNLQYPDPATWNRSLAFHARGVRWVLATPPVFELSADVANVDGSESSRERVYFTPCTRLVGFERFGNGLWARLDLGTRPRPGEKRSGSWTFYVDDVQIGSIPSNRGLRANR